MTKLGVFVLLLPLSFPCVAQADEGKRLEGFVFSCNADGVCTKTDEMSFVVNEGLVVDGVRLSAPAQVDLVDSILQAPEGLKTE